MKRTCSWRRQLEGTIPVEAKKQRKWLWNLWERRMTPEPDNFMHQTGRLTTWKYTKRVRVYSYKTPIKKAQPNLFQTTIIFITGLTISFLLLSTSSASAEFGKLTTLDKMILLAVNCRGLMFNVPSSNERMPEMRSAQYQATIPLKFFIITHNYANV